MDRAEVEVALAVQPAREPGLILRPSHHPRSAPPELGLGARVVVAVPELDTLGGFAEVGHVSSWWWKEQWSPAGGFEQIDTVSVERGVVGLRGVRASGPIEVHAQLELGVAAARWRSEPDGEEGVWLVPATGFAVGLAPAAGVVVPFAELGGTWIPLEPRSTGGRFNAGGGCARLGLRLRLGP